MSDKNAVEAYHLNRRLALGLGFAAAAGLCSNGALAAELDPSNPEDLRMMFRKLQYRTDSGLVFWWMRGRYFGQIDAALTPLYGLNWGVIQRVAQRSDGGFDVREIELSFHTDLEFKQRLTTFHNPITNEDVAVEFSPLGPSVVHYSRDNLPQIPTQMVGSTAESTSIPPEALVIGDQILFSSRSATRVMTPGVPDRTFNDITTISGSLKAARDPSVTSVPAMLQSSDVTSWQRGLKMGDQPGSMTLRALGGKVGRLDHMPPSWLAMLRDAAPDIAADPEGALDRAPARFKN